jgi:hypothetical protein
MKRSLVFALVLAMSNLGCNKAVSPERFAFGEGRHLGYSIEHVKGNWRITFFCEGFTQEERGDGVAELYDTAVELAERNYNEKIADKTDEPCLSLEEWYKKFKEQSK